MPPPRTIFGNTILEFLSMVFSSMSPKFIRDFLYGSATPLGNVSYLILILIALITFDKHPNKAACIITDIGDMIILTPSMADEIRNDSRLSFTAFSFFQTEYPGFEAFREGTLDSITLTVINKDLTKHLAKITEPLAEETTQTLNELTGKSTEWQTIALKDTILHLVTRISSRVFLGEELCRDPAWLKIRREHTINGFMDGDLLRQWPDHRLWDPKVYTNPEQWDVHRFLNLRQLPGKEHVSQLVSTSENHLGFGHGKHACPGRFFAANELKIALVHLLRDYEWKLPGKQAISIHDFGMNPLLEPTIKMEIRAR
ncbi:hypothetical protein TruAng_009065 [Truncatella angustata]|nr:hypothetical protein TruAng_009065 [Truncatella angustata]